MREDMYKVIVERPRRHKGNDTQAARRRNDNDGPQHLGMRVGYGYRVLNENLNPLRRQAKIDSRRRVLDANTQLLLLAGEWFEVKVAPLQYERLVEIIVNGRKIHKRKTEQRFDAVQKRMVSSVDTAEGEKLYGDRRLYAISKRQLSRQELKTHGLR